MIRSARIGVVVGIIPVILALTAPGVAQRQPSMKRSFQDIIENAHRWMKAGSFHVAEYELEQALPLVVNPSERTDILMLLMNATFQNQEYEQSFQWANAFLGELPSDGERQKALYIRGVSAFQIGQAAVARASLESFLYNGPPNQAERGIAFYWRGMCELQANDLHSAEQDFRGCLLDSSAREVHDAALISLSSLLEQRNEVVEASATLKRLLTDFPRSNFNVDARLRLASLSLRQGDALQTLRILQEVHPRYTSQKEESLILESQADFALGDFGNSALRFKEFLARYPESPAAHTARLGLAWSLLKSGDPSGARREFEFLSTGNDSIASAALYELGMIALVSGNTADALTDLNALVTKFPYDAYADEAYYQIGMIRYREQHYREARRNFLYVTQLFPESKLLGDAHRMSGECSMALSDFSNGQYDFAQVQRQKSSASLLAPSMFQEGICLYHLGRFKSSAQRFGEFLKNFPSDARAAEAYVWRGEAQYQDYRFEEAERSFTEALHRFPQNPKQEDAEYGVAWSLFEQKKFLQAADAFDRFVARHSGSDRRLDASLRKADCYFFLGKYDKASEMYASLAAEKSSSRRSEYAAFQLAMSYVQRGESQRGIDQLQSFLVRYPSSMYCEVARFNIGWIHFSNEHYGDAIEEFRLLQRQFPESQLMPRVLFNMGDAFYNLKNYDSAHVYYQKVLDAYPTSPLAADALSGLQFTFQAEGKSTEALATLEKYLGAKPAGIPTEELIVKKGDLLFGQNDFNGAAQEYQRVLSLHPTRAVKAKALHKLGRAYELQNNAQRAISYYEQVVSEFSETEDAPPVSLSLYSEYMKLKQYRSAAKLLENFGSRYPDSPLLAEARYDLALALMNIPDRQRAFEEFRSVILHHPADIFADRSRLEIARLYSQGKEYQASLDTLNGIVARRNDDLTAEALVLIGDTYVALKRYKDGLQAYHDVVVQYKDVPLLVERAHLQTGACYERLHDRVNARRAYEEILKSPVDQDIKKEAEQRLKRLRR